MTLLLSTCAFISVQYNLHSGHLKLKSCHFMLQKTKKQMETTRDQLAEALYQKGLALSEIESLKVQILFSDCALLYLSYMPI